MSVDTLRETFHINRVTPDKIQDFLTAQTYRPEITKAKEKIKTLPWVSLQSACKRPIRQGKSPSYADDAGLLCIKPKNTNEMIVSLEALSYIQPASKDDVAGQRLQKGDIVITRSGSGTIGRASIFLSDEEVYTNDHLFIVRTDGADSNYTCAFLNTYWGHRLLEAGISGSTGQLNLSNEHIKGITLYTPAELAQKYIGDKVRQAERLRALSKQFSARLESAVEEIFAGNPKPKKAHRNYVSNAILIEKRLDAEFYAPESLWAEAEITKSKYGFAALGDLTVRIKDGPGGWGVSTNDYQETGVPVIRSVNIIDGECDLRDCVYISEKKHQDLISHEAKRGSVLLSVRGTIGRAAVFNDHQYRVSSLNAAVVTIDCKDGINPYFLAAFFNSPVGRIQANRIANGAVQLNMNLTETASNLVVTPPQKIQEEIAEIFKAKIEAKNSSKHLTTAAKLLVESLIEGHLTEAELIAAEQALQAGNAQFDRRILNRLKTDGIDGHGPALFGDLDELDRLLAQAGVE